MKTLFNKTFILPNNRKVYFFVEYRSDLFLDFELDLRHLTFWESKKHGGHAKYFRFTVFGIDGYIHYNDDSDLSNARV